MKPKRKIGAEAEAGYVRGAGGDDYPAIFTNGRAKWRAHDKSNEYIIPGVCYTNYGEGNDHICISFKPRTRDTQITQKEKNKQTWIEPHIKK